MGFYKTPNPNYFRGLYRGAGFGRVDSIDPFASSVFVFVKADGSLVDSSSSPKTITAFGDAVASTAQKKYGSGSLLLDGSGDYITASLSGDAFNIRTDSYTLECFYYNTASGNFALFSDGNNFYLDYFSGKWYVGDGVINNISLTRSITLNQWIHMALSFDGTTYRLFEDGIQIASSTTLLKSYSLSTLYIGGRVTQSSYFNGYIDVARGTSVARYSSAFNPESDSYLDV